MAREKKKKKKQKTFYTTEKKKIQEIRTSTSIHYSTTRRRHVGQVFCHISQGSKQEA